MPPMWYVMHSKPCKEEFLWNQLRARAIECFYPCMHLLISNSRARKDRPYFPGYVFIHTDLEKVGLSALRWMPGAAGVVAFGGEPAWVPENLINAIRRRLEQVNMVSDEELTGLKAGDPVVICDGPFEGYQAIFDAHLSSDERVRVLLSLLNKQHLVLELPGSYIVRQ
jgi:transcription antitermination factor NusG